MKFLQQEIPKRLMLDLFAVATKQIAKHLGFFFFYLTEKLLSGINVIFLIRIFETSRYQFIFQKLHRYLLFISNIYIYLNYRQLSLYLFTEYPFLYMYFITDAKNHFKAGLRSDLIQFTFFLFLIFLSKPFVFVRLFLWKLQVRKMLS